MIMFAFGKSIPTSITVVETSILNIPSRNAILCWEILFKFLSTENRKITKKNKITAKVLIIIIGSKTSNKTKY